MLDYKPGCLAYSASVATPCILARLDSCQMQTINESFKVNYQCLQDEGGHVFICNCNQSDIFLHICEAAVTQALIVFLVEVHS